MEIEELVQETIEQMQRVSKKNSNNSNTSDEKEFLEFIKSRSEVLFMGLKSEGLENSEDKLNLTIEFLEFLQEITKKRLEKLV